MTEASRSSIAHDDPRLHASLDLLRRTGAVNVTLGYQDEVTPVVWFAMATWPRGSEAAGALNPLRAVIRLLEIIVDGGQCAHCGKPSAISDDWETPMPLNQLVCWYIYDPELQKFRRGCEGDS